MHRKSQARCLERPGSAAYSLDFFELMQKLVQEYKFAYELQYLL